MKIINKITNETVAEILGGENLTLDEALDLIGAVNVDDMDNDLAEEKKTLDEIKKVFC